MDTNIDINNTIDNKSIKKLVIFSVAFMAVLVALITFAIIKINDNKILCIVLIVISSILLIATVIKLVYEVVLYIKISKARSKIEGDLNSNIGGFKDYNYNIESKTSNVNFGQKNRRTKFMNLNNGGFSYKYDSGEGLDNIVEERRSRKGGFNFEKLKMALLIALGLIAMMVVTLLLYVI